MGVCTTDPTAPHPTRTVGPTTRGNRRSYVVDLTLLTLLCLIAYFPGLSNYGPANWQEAQRAIVAQDMQRLDSWLIPTVNGLPYLAKPPLLYWCTLAIAHIRGSAVGLVDLRLTVAIAGLLGVLGTYLCARIILNDPSPFPLLAPTRRRLATDAWARSAAFWSALLLAGGVLYFRSSRIGELDILLVPASVLAIGAIVHAWRIERVHGRTHWPAIGLAALGAMAAAMTKGPPGLLAIVLGGYGGVLLAETHDLAPGRSRFASRIVAAAIGLAATTAAFIGRDVKYSPVTAAFGSVVIGLMVALLALLTARVGRAGGFRAVWRGLWCTHPVLVLGSGLGVLWLWGWLVRQRIGDSAMSMAADEVEDNLRMLVARSPLLNFEAILYGVGMGSALAILCVLWLLKDRPRIRQSWLFVFAWAGLTYVAMSLLGKGIGRYLTPMWPALAILGGMYVATLLADTRRPRLAKVSLIFVALAFIGVQSWWYGFGRDRFQAELTPRPLVAELLTRYRIDPSRLTTLNFRTPALDYEVGHWVQPAGDIRTRESIAGGAAWTIDELAADIRAHGPRIVLVRRSKSDDPKGVPTEIRPLIDSGLSAELLETRAVFDAAGRKPPIVAVRVRAP